MEIMQIEERMPSWIHVPVSGCCGEYLTEGEAEVGVCCCCREACDVEIMSMMINEVK